MAGESITSVVLSPRFKSAAALAGWDEESLLSASLIVDDTPERELSQKKRSVFQSRSTASRKKRRAHRSPAISIPIVTLDLGNDAVETVKNETDKDAPKTEKDEKEGEREVSTSLPCLEKLREELSCAICLDICFEPSTTPCGHSFCLKCLQFSTSKCGKKCPKCRQLISNGRSCTVNTVLWNTIQLLFPQEVEAKKAASASKCREPENRRKIPENSFYDSLRNGSSRDSDLPRTEETPSPTRRRRSSSTHSSRTENPASNLEREIRRNIRAAASRIASRDSRAMVSQDGDRALALRLQREEFIRGNISTNVSLRTTLNQFSTSTNPASTNPSSFSSARENLRAMASRAVTTLRFRQRF